MATDTYTFIHGYIQTRLEKYLIFACLNNYWKVLIHEYINIYTIKTLYINIIYIYKAFFIAAIAYIVKQVYLKSMLQNSGQAAFIRFWEEHLYRSKGFRNEEFCCWWQQSCCFIFCQVLPRLPKYTVFLGRNATMWNHLMVYRLVSNTRIRTTPFC